jgi:hypothetical protein
VTARRQRDPVELGAQVMVGTRRSMIRACSSASTRLTPVPARSSLSWSATGRAACSSRPPSTSNGAASVLRIVEFGPGYASPRHRTLSIDYLFVLSGELELELDKGTLVRLYQGDIVVGVIRARTRRAGSWCR